MNNEWKPKRDEKGDVNFGNHKFDWDRFNWWRFTYVFHYYNEERQYHFPYFDLFDHDDERLEIARKEKDYKEMVLYHIPLNPPFDFYIHYHNWQLSLLVKYFKEVFEERAFIDGYIPQNKYYRIILPYSIHSQIINVINDFKLLPIRDLIFEIIATAQYKYVEEGIAFWNEPDNQKIISTAQKESNKAIKLIEKIEDKKWRRDANAKPPAKLNYVNFVFQDESIKIEHPWLSKEFIEHFKKYYDSLPYKNWRIDLERYPEHFNENRNYQEFKYRLAISLYNLFSKEGFFSLQKKVPYPNDLLLCIAKIIEFSLIPVGSFDDPNEIKIKHIRNWLKRKELQEAITYLDVPPNKERLLNYFDESFINYTGDSKRADALIVGFYLGKRFDLPHLTVDLVHLAQVMRSWHFLIGHRFPHNNIDGEIRFPELIAFDTLLKTIRSKGPLTNIKFKIGGDDHEYEFTQRLPLYLIEQAIKEHTEDHSVEYEVDVVKTKTIQHPDGGIERIQDEVFNRPEERFMVKFVGSFYNYLLHEAPPGEQDRYPSKRYYTIIASFLQKVHFFSRPIFNDDFVIAKVQQWHELKPKSSN